jgi:hypothetical protein
MKFASLRQLTNMLKDHEGVDLAIDGSVVGFVFYGSKLSLKRVLLIDIINKSNNKDIVVDIFEKALAELRESEGDSE